MSWGDTYSQLLGGPSDETTDPSPGLGFNDPRVVGSVTAPSARFAPVATPGVASLYPQYTPHPGLVDLLAPSQTGQPSSWRDVLMKSLIAGLGNVAMRRVGLNPLLVQSAAQSRQKELDLEDYKARLVNAQMLRSQLSDEAARRTAARTEAQARFETAGKIFSHINELTSAAQISEYKSYVKDLVGPLGIDVDKLPSLPSVGALAKIRKGYVDTFDATVDGMKKKGWDMTQSWLYDENDPRAPSIDVMGPDGPVSLKLGKLAKLAYGAGFDISKLPVTDEDKFTGNARVLADKLAKQKYGPNADYHALSYDDLQQITKDTAESRHITVNTGTSGPTEDNATLGDMVFDGMAVPSLLGKNRGQLNAIVAYANKRSLKETGKPYNWLQAESRWQASKRWVQSMNAPQMQNFAGLAQSVVSTIGEVQRLGNLLQQSGVKNWNNLKRSALTSYFGNTPYSKTANDYMIATNALKEEFAQLANGGYAPTDPAWKLANEQVNADFGVADLNSSLAELKQIINYRIAARYDVDPVIPGERPTFATEAEAGAHPPPVAPTKPPTAYTAGDIVVRHVAGQPDEYYVVKGAGTGGNIPADGPYRTRAEAAAARGQR